MISFNFRVSLCRFFFFISYDQRRDSGNEAIHYHCVWLIFGFRSNSISFLKLGAPELSVYIFRTAVSIFSFMAKGSPSLFLRVLLEVYFFGC